MRRELSRADDSAGGPSAGPRAALWRPFLIPVCIALAVVVFAGIFAEQQNRTVHNERVRAEVLDKLSILRARLEGNINGNIQLVRGLVSAVSTEPDMDQARFSALAESLFSEGTQLRNIAGAPDLIVSLMYPMDGNEGAMGLDYSAHEAQRDAVLKARDTGKLVLAGPVRLVQGGMGFIGRFPVFTRNGSEPAFWGVVSAVIDAERLYVDSGLRGEIAQDLALAITSNDPAGGLEPFFGYPAVIGNDPVTANVILPGAVWQIAATPKAGWELEPPNTWSLRLTILIAGMLVVLPILVAGRMIDQRQKHVSELRRREQQLKELSQRLSLALDSSKVGIWELDLVSGRLVWDDRMYELYFLSRDVDPQTPGLWEKSLHPEDASRALAELNHAVATDGSYQSDFRVLGPNGEVRHIRAVAAVYRDGASRKIVGVNWDITADVALNKALLDAKRLTEARNLQLEDAKQRIEFDALHDSLTGLPNRRYLDELLSAIDRRKGKLGLLQIDLDRFKQINDTLGHATGDAMLVHAAKVLRANVRAADFIARIGGDEFVIVCRDASADEMAALADRIIAQMRHPVIYEGHECRFGVSVGIALERDGAGDPKHLLIDADIALYRAKSRGRNRHEFFTDALQQELLHGKHIADQILTGLERREFTAYYQPQFDTRTLDIVGVEALARWNHPTRGLLTPDVFLAMAEELNVVSTLDRLILEQALTDRAAWLAAGLAMPRVSVNVSARRLHDEGLIRGLRELAIEPGTVAFEFVESIYLDESDELVAWNIDQIKELGIDIEIDDFGTGYASIVSLLKLRPRRLKIDRQLITPIVTSLEQRQLVASIIDIGRSLNIEVVAEGVETRAHVEVLRDLGCDILQGYAFARAMSAADLARFLGAETWRKAS